MCYAIFDDVRAQFGDDCLIYFGEEDGHTFGESTRGHRRLARVTFADPLPFELTERAAAELEFNRLINKKPKRKKHG